MPLLRTGTANICDPDVRVCANGSECVSCIATKHLTQKDWDLVSFYQKVQGQYDNLTPNGNGDKPPIIHLRFEALRAALDTYSYRREDWRYFCDGAFMLHDLMHRIRTIDWMKEVGKQRNDIRTEDLEWPQRTS